MKKRILMIILLLVVNFIYAQSNSYPTTGNIKAFDYSPLLILQRNTATGGFIQGVQTKFQDGTDNWYFGNVHAGSWIVSKGDYQNPKMTVLDNGNVGIGTISPVSKLDVRGDLYLNSGNDDNHVYWADHNMTMGTRPGDYAHNVFSLKPGGASQGKLFSVFSMYNANSSTSFESKIQLHTDGPSFLNGGNVGIGTISPVSKLDVRGDLYLNSGNDDNHVYWADHNMTMGTRPGDYAHNVFSLKPGGASQGKLFSVFSMYNANSSTSFESKIQLHTDGPSFLNGGNVGIGSTNPDSKLTVKGKIHAEEVKIDLAVPADYVFEKYYLGKSSLKPDYTLLTLSEVEKFTKENHHLPNVPSAKEIKKNGLLLGEMSNVLLQKIEELTLYVIEQNKELKMQNENFEKQSTLLKSQNEKVLTLEKKIESLTK
jgi:hypothetical protein